MLFIHPVLLACQPLPTEGKATHSDTELQAQAVRLAHQLMIADTHIDVPYRLSEKMEDISVRTTGGEFDYPRARAGGLDVAFMSIYVPARYESNGAKALADQLIGMVEGLARKSPDKFALASTVRAIQKNFREGKVSLPMGMENGAPIEGDLENLKYFYDRGIRYITLTHSKNNHICDSSYDNHRKWNGLSPFGQKVVPEMNRLGIMIDVSHISDDAFLQLMDLTKAPVIASHSSCRSFTPGLERNLSDELLLKLKENGGVIQINFGSFFLKNEYSAERKEKEAQITRELERLQLTRESPAGRQFALQYHQKNPSNSGTVADVADHIDHVVRLIGIDHVGLGSDFDGVSGFLPKGLKDVSQYPNLIAELLKRGYSEEEIEKICSGNLLRVWSEVERLARQFR